MSAIEHTSSTATPLHQRQRSNDRRGPGGTAIGPRGLVAISWIAPVALVLIWEALARDGWLSPQILPAPSKVLAAADALDAVARRRDEGIDDPALAHAAALAAAKAKIVVDDLALRSGGLIFDVAGASATLRAANLDRHWRNARALASHNPASYKAMAVGAHAIHGTPLPAKGFF